MEFNYQQTYQLMRKFNELGKTEVLIMDYLMQRDYAEVTITQLAKIICKDASNTQKALNKLEKRGIVCIVHKYYEDECEGCSNPMKACFIVDGWMNAFLAGGWDKF